MTEVEFDESKESSVGTSNILYARIQPSDIEPGLVRALKKLRIVKTSRQANIVLLIFVLLCIITAGLVFLKLQKGYIIPPAPTKVIFTPADTGLNVSSFPNAQAH